MKTINELKIKLHEINKNPKEAIEKLLNSINNKTIKKIFSKGPLYNLKPFESECAGIKVGTEIKKLPKNLKNTHLYYFDHDNQLIMVEKLSTNGLSLYKTFYFHHDDGIDVIGFYDVDSIGYVSFLSKERDVITNEYNYGKYGESTSSYIYKNNSLEKIIVQKKEHDQENFTSHEVLFFYDDLLNLTKIVHSHQNGYVEQRYP